MLCQSPCHIRLWPADAYWPKHLAFNFYLLQALVRGLLESLIIRLACWFQNHKVQSIKRKALPHLLGFHSPSSQLSSASTLISFPSSNPNTANNRLERPKTFFSAVSVSLSKPPDCSLQGLGRTLSSPIHLAAVLGSPTNTIRSAHLRRSKAEAYRPLARRSLIQQKKLCFLATLI